MRRQFEKVLNDFQPGLLETLKKMSQKNSDTNHDDEVCWSHLSIGIFFYTKQYYHLGARVKI
jgi:hypothetical protein